VAKVENLKAVLDAYGVAVRAGVITPSIDDEVAFREKLGLPALSEDARADWAKTDNVRKPITLAGANMIPGAPAPDSEDEDGD